MSGRDDFPGLRFDPTPGIPPAIDQLAGQVKAAMDNFSAGTQAIDRAGGVTAAWTGDAADGMHKKMAELRPIFATALTALTSTHNVLKAWSQHLAALQQRRAALESEAVAARQSVAQAKVSPGADFTPFDAAYLVMSDAEKSAAYQQGLAAQRAIKQAEDRLDEIIDRAKRLKKEHGTEAELVAKVIQQASALAPQKPDDDPWYKDAYDGVVDAVTNPGDTFTKMGDFAADASTGVGVVSLFLSVMPPPVDLAGFYLNGVSAYLSATAFVFHGLGWAFGGDADGWDLANDAFGAIPVVGPWGHAWYYLRPTPLGVDVVSSVGGPVVRGVEWVWQQFVGEDGKVEMRPVAPMPPEEKVFYDTIVAEQVRVQQEARK